MAKSKPASQFSKESLSEFYQQHFPALYKYFYYKVLSAEAAQDLSSETFLSFAEQVGIKEIENPRAFLYGIAYYKLQDFLRYKYKLPRVDGDISELEIVGMVDTEIKEQSANPSPEDIIRRLLPQLPEQQRQIIELRLLGKLSLPEICDQIGKDMSYVKTTQSRAIKRLKSLLAGIPDSTNI